MFRCRGALVPLLCCLALAAPAPAEEEEDEAELRERLTEREDKRRPLEPFSIDVAGRPLTLGGEWELELGYVRRRFLDEDAVEEPNRFLMEQALEVEAFYTLGQPLSLFVQLAGVLEEDLLSDTPGEVSSLFIEPGEIWLYTENILGSHVNLDIGRLDFEDDRRWWWDEELEAVRVAYERDTYEITLALAQEQTTDRYDRGLNDVDPDEDGLVRWIGEVGWDWSENHALELFLLHQNDHSPTEKTGEVVNSDREDDSDGSLTWVGARVTGIFDLRARGYLGYWLDTALVRGREHLIEYGEPDPPQPGKSLVEDIVRRDVSGWAFDLGASWILPLAYEPRIFAGYAFGSGDSHPEKGTDRNFRQTGIEANEAGFGGVERFISYGPLLDPELSNLGIVTVGAGLSLLRSSSLDLVYHHYRMDEAATELDIRPRATLSGEDRDVGDEIDLVLALEEWERLEFTFIASAFRAGHAFVPEDRSWSFGGFAAMRIAF